jgi:hypothetical protein
MLLRGPTLLSRARFEPRRPPCRSYGGMGTGPTATIGCVLFVLQSNPLGLSSLGASCSAVIAVFAISARSAPPPRPHSTPVGLVYPVFSSCSLEPRASGRTVVRLAQVACARTSSSWAALPAGFVGQSPFAATPACILSGRTTVYVARSSLCCDLLALFTRASLLGFKCSKWRRMLRL